MSAAVGDILKVTLHETFLGQKIENVFFYRLTGVPSPAAGETFEQLVAERFNVVVAFHVRAIQSTFCLNTIIRVDNITNGIDFYELTVGVAGDLAADPLASFDAINFVLRRTTGITRNGSKRIGGLTENGVSGNTVIIAAGTLNPLEASLSADLVTADAVPVAFAEPVIVGRIFDPTVGASGGYVLDLTKINPIASASATAVSTQRSRKAGHGT